MSSATSHSDVQYTSLCDEADDVIKSKKSETFRNNVTLKLIILAI